MDLKKHIQISLELHHYKMMAMVKLEFTPWYLFRARKALKLEMEFYDIQIKNLYDEN